MKDSTSEKASRWFKENESHIVPSQSVLHHLLKYYSGQPVSWRKESPVKIVLGSNNKPGRISITPQIQPNIRLRFVPLDTIDRVTHFVEELERVHGSYLTFKLNGKSVDITSDFQDESIIKLQHVTDLILNEFNFTDFTKPKSYNFSYDHKEEAQSIQRKAVIFKNILLNEAAMERRFVNWLKAEHDIDAKCQDSDGPFRRDVTYTHDDCSIIAELKYTSSARENIEQAIGQLLRYKLHPAAKKDSDKLIIVSGGSTPTNDDIEWFRRLKKVLGLNIGMLCEDPTTNGVFKDPSSLTK